MDLVKEFKSCEVGLRALFDIKSSKAHRAYIQSLLTGEDFEQPEVNESDIPEGQWNNRVGEINNLLASVISNRGIMQEDPEFAESIRSELVLELVEVANRAARLSVNPESAGQHDIAIESLRRNGRSDTASVNK